MVLVNFFRIYNHVLSKFFRQNIFWTIDVLKGNPVKNHYIDIKNIVENPSSVLSISKKEEYLNQIMEHAVNTTEFYKKNKGYNSILDFPIINKNLIRDNFDAFCSSNFETGNTITNSTSGSTGAPFSFRSDKNKRRRNTADTLYFAKRSGYELGQRIIHIKIWSESQEYKLFSKFWLKNIYPQSVFNLTNKDIDKLIESIKNDSSKISIIGYASALEKICKYLDSIDSKPLNCNVVSIIAISEAVNPYTKEATKKYFGVSCVSRYSNNENGILAQEDVINNEGFVMNQASYYIELFDLNKDVLVEKGKLGRIVVTDLHNYAMPFIRYDTGDLGILKNDHNDVPYLSRVNGRKLDAIYDTSGNVVPSHLSYKLCKYGEYKQFQLVQNGEKSYLIKLNTDEKVDEDAIIKEYRTYFGQNAIITIKYVNEIPLLASGKRQEVLNTYHSKEY